MSPHLAFHAQHTFLETGCDSVFQSDSFCPRLSKMCWVLSCMWFSRPSSSGVIQYSIDHTRVRVWIGYSYRRSSMGHASLVVTCLYFVSCTITGCLTPSPSREVNGDCDYAIPTRVLLWCRNLYIFIVREVDALIRKRE